MFIKLQFSLNDDDDDDNCDCIKKNSNCLGKNSFNDN